MKTLSILDNLFLQLERREVPMNVGGLMVFQLPENYPGNYFEDLLAAYRDVHNYAAPFHYRLAPSVSKILPARWIEDRYFDLSYHLRHSALPQPGTMDQLLTLVSRLHSTLLDRSRPLWEFHLIEGLEGNRFAIYLKIHHACMDGLRGMQLLQANLSDDLEDHTIWPLWKKKKKTKPTQSESRSPSSNMPPLVKMLTKQAQTIPEMAQLFTQIGQHVLEKENLVPLPYTSPETSLNGRITGQRRLAIQDLNLSEVKKFGKTMDATVNDVVLAICAGALRRYLDEYGELPEESLTALLPVALPSEKSGGNLLTNMVCQLATELEDPIERLKTIQASTAANKALLKEISNRTATYYNFIFHGPSILTMALNVNRHLPPPFNVLISNVPGPRHSMYLNGAKLEGMYPVSFLFDGQALNMTVLSYEDRLQFGLMACRDNVSDVDHLGIYIKEAFDELVEAAQ